MKLKITLFLGLLCLGFTSSAQIKFEKGYFIANSGEKTHCYIKNKDWKNNPIKFEYKLNKNSEVFVNSIENVLEFGINNSSKFQKHTVAIDKSSSNINRLSKTRVSEYSKETLFLKVLVEGEASLLLYENGSLIRFFYKLKSSHVKQLEYKLYTSKDGASIRKNYNYRYQLSKELSCKNLETNYLKYSKKAIIDYFIKFNTCNKSKQFIDYTKKIPRTLFNSKLKLGVGLTSMHFKNAAEKSYQKGFKANLSYRVGLEGELILPYNKNKWGVFMSSVFQFHKITSSESFNTDYSSIEVAFGIRHYFFVKNASKLFVNGGIVLDFPIKTSLEFVYANTGFIGFGYVFKDKINIESRYYFPRHYLNEPLYKESDFSSFNLMLGYKLF